MSGLSCNVCYHSQGALTVVSKDLGAVKRLESQLKQVCACQIIVTAGSMADWRFTHALTASTLPASDPQASRSLPSSHVIFTHIVSTWPQVIRAMYSSPPRHGAEIAELVLSDPQLFRDWKVCAARLSTPLCLFRQAVRSGHSTLHCPITVWVHGVHSLAYLSTPLPLVTHLLAGHRWS